jgi:hypothetical protein
MHYLLFRISTGFSRRSKFKNFNFTDYYFSQIKVVGYCVSYTGSFLQCLHYPGGVVYMAGKKHYFGVGGGTRQFLRLVEEDGKLFILCLPV